MRLKRKSLIWLIVLLVVAVAAWYGYREYNRTNPDLKDSSADYSLPAQTLLAEFELNDSIASIKYSGKTLEVTGQLKGVEVQDNRYYTLVLGENEGLSSTRCSMDTTYSEEAAGLTTGITIVIRGVCTGFNRDDMGLGSDVILNRCVIVK